MKKNKIKSFQRLLEQIKYEKAKSEYTDREKSKWNYCIQIKRYSRHAKKHYVIKIIVAFYLVLSILIGLALMD